MKKFLIAAAFIAAAASASAATFWYDGVLMGTVCRNGPWYTVYPNSMAQPVGSQCPVRSPAGYVIGVGIVTSE